MGEYDPRELAKHGYEDPVFFLRTFLKHLFPGEIPWVHRGLLAILTRKSRFLLEYGELKKIRDNFVVKRNDEEVRVFNPDMTMNLGKYTVVFLPRGFSKTTIAGIAVPIMDIVYQDIRFGAYISEAAPHSKMQLTNIKRELVDNTLLVECFGSLKPSLSDDEKWSEEFFETTTGCAFAARGRGGQIRGLNHLGQRPQKIICDDLEDDESVATELQREKVRNWAYGDLLPALPELDPSATITVLGTMLHPDCLMETFAADPMFTCVKMGARDKDGEPLWGINLDEKKLEEKKLSFQNAGQLHTYYMEYFNIAHAPETQIFRQEFFIHERPSETDILRGVIYLDPAASKDPKADRSVIALIQQNQKGVLFLMELWVKRGASEEEKIEEYFRLHKLYSCTLAGVESNAYQVSLVHNMREWMFRKGHYFEILPVHNKVKKIERIPKILRPRYASGYVKHAKRFLELESEMLDFPRGKHDDCPDAVAGCISLIDPWAAAAAGEKDLGDDEYEPLEDVLGNWRLA